MEEVEDEEIPSDSMPGFDDEIDEIDDALAHEDIDFLAPEPQHHKFKAESSNHSAAASSSSLQCPLCSRMFDTDNAGLNAHIDWCLSRGAIMSAQSEATNFGSTSTLPRKVEKPLSKGRQTIMGWRTQNQSTSKG